MKIYKLKVGDIVRHRRDGRIGFICKKSIFKNFQTVFWFHTGEIINHVHHDLEVLS